MGGLFGDFEPKPSRKKEKGQSASQHNDLLYHWANAWERKYGSKYPFTKADIGHISTILKSIPDLEGAKHAFDEYLRDGERFLQGHPLGRIFGKLSKYVLKKPIQRAGEYPESAEIPAAHHSLAADTPIDQSDIPF